MLHAARCKYRTQKSPPGHHRTTSTGYIFATKARIDNRKKMLNSSISSTRPHNMVNILTAEICSGVLGTPANFNGFRVLASILHRRRSTEVNQTLHDIWPSPGLRRLLTLTAFWHCRVQKFTLRPCDLRYWHRYCTVLQQ